MQVFVVVNYILTDKPKDITFCGSICADCIIWHEITVMKLQKQQYDIENAIGWLYVMAQLYDIWNIYVSFKAAVSF